MSGGDRSYTTLPINIVMRGASVGEVVESKDASFKKGDIVMGQNGWQEYGVSKASQAVKINPGVKMQDAMSLLGGVGLTGRVIAWQQTFSASESAE